MEVKLIDYMGSDLRVVHAARVSFNKESEWNKTYFNHDGSETDRAEFAAYSKKELSEADQKLIKYLAKHNHWTPFSHVMITLREKVPIFVARQRFKHMVGFTYNEVSRRYVDDPPEFYIPDVWRSKPEGSIKQGSGTDVITEFGEQQEIWLVHPSKKISEHYEHYIKLASGLYSEMLRAGVAPEQARMVLPQSMYTEYYVTGSLAAWARAYVLRKDPHAQLEIQYLAVQWDKIISEIKELEHSWKALTN